MNPEGAVTTIQVYGRLGRAPEKRTTAVGKAMVTGSMVVDLRRNGEMPEWFSLIAFGTIGEALERHATGDMVAISGRLTKAGWTGRDRAEGSGFSVCVDSIASARTVRPRRPKVQSRDEYERPRDEQDAVPFDDPLGC